MDKLSYTLESYLDAVYELSLNANSVRLTDIANRMSVTKSTANAAMVSLAEKKLVLNERYGDIKLTESGLKTAKLITQKHEILLNFFTEVLRLDPRTADADACSIEHVISNDTIHAMQAYLKK